MKFKPRYAPATGPCEFAETCYMHPRKCRGTEVEAGACSSRGHHLHCRPREEREQR